MTQVDQVGFSCAACGKQYRWKPELAGKSVKCKCGSPIKVPREMGGAVAPAPVSAKPQVGIAAARASAEVPPRAPKPVKPKPVEEDGGGGDLDALMALAQQEADTAEDAASQADTNFCANCRTRMSPEAVICMNCGFDRRKGNVIATAKVKDPNARRLFGLLPPASESAKKKKPVDMMAPQGSFMIGMAASVGLGLVGAVLSFVIALVIKMDLFFLIPLVGIGAGVGMQIGQRGYSTVGGLFAAIVTLILIIPTRLLIVILIVIPAKLEAMADRAERRAAQEERLEIQPFNPDNVFKERPYNDRNNNAEIGENEDPRVVAMIAKDLYVELHWNPEFATPDQHNHVDIVARHRATTMPVEKKNAYIAEMDKKAEAERFVEDLIGEQMDLAYERNPDLNYRAARATFDQTVNEKVRKMTPEDIKNEKARLKEVQKARMAKAQTRMAERQKEMKKEADAAAALDGFDSSDATADGGDEDAAMDEDGADEGFDDEEGAAPKKKAVATTQGARPTTPAVAAKPAPASDDADDSDDSDSASADAGGEDGADGDDAEAPGILSIGLGAILILIFFGGIFKFFFMIGSIFLAYRTAAGATWG